MRPQIRLEKSLRFYVGEAVHDAGIVKAKMAAEAGRDNRLGGSGYPIQLAQAVSNCLEKQLPHMFAAYNDERRKFLRSRPELDSCLLSAIDVYFADQSEAEPSREPAFGGSGNFFSTQIAKEQQRMLETAEEHLRRPGLLDWPERFPRRLAAVTGLVGTGLGWWAKAIFERLLT